MNKDKKTLSTTQLALLESEMAKAKRSTAVAYLLLIFLGTIGTHQFYLGKTERGFAYFATPTIGFGSLFMGGVSKGISGIFFGVSIACTGLWFLMVAYDLFTLGTQTNEANDLIEARLIGEIKDDAPETASAA